MATCNEITAKIRKNISSVSSDGTCHLWHFKADMRPYKYTQHKGKVNCVSYSPDGKFVASGGDDGKIFVWKAAAEGNKFNFNFRAHGGPVKSVVFSQDGNFLVSGGDDKVVKLWRVLAKGKVKFLRSFLGHKNWVLKADISPDSRLIASICDKHIKVWDASTGKEFIDFRNVQTGNRSLAFHPDGNYVAIGGSSGLLQMLDLRANKLSQVYDTQDTITDLSFHISGQFVACTYEYNQVACNSVLKIFDLRQGRCIYKMGGVYNSLYCVKFNKDGGHFAVGGKDQLVYVWKTNFKPFEPVDESDEEELVEVKDREKEVFIGTALNLEEHTNQKRSQKRAGAYEKLTMTLESLVSSVNTISQTLSSLDRRLDNSERKTAGIMKIVEMREIQNRQQDPDFENRGFERVEFNTNGTIRETEEEDRDENSTLFGYTATQRTNMDIDGAVPNWPMTMNTENLIQGISVSDASTYSQMRADSMRFDPNSTVRTGTYNSRFVGSEKVDRYRQGRLMDDGEDSTRRNPTFHTEAIEEKIERFQAERKFDDQDEDDESEVNNELMETVEKKLTTTQDFNKQVIFTFKTKEQQEQEMEEDSMEVRKEDYEYTTEREIYKQNSVSSLLGKQGVEQLVREVHHSDAILNTQEEDDSAEEIDGEDVF